MVTRTWQPAISRVRTSKVLPLGFGKADDVEPNAWLGSKLLSAAVALSIQQAVDLQKLGEARDIHSRVTSGAFLRSQLPTIMPCHSDAIGPDISAQAACTLVEAAVAVVHAAEGRACGSAAVAELADHLVACGMSEPAIAHAKAKLLELGGSISCERTGGTDDAPVFRAEAELGSTRLVISGGPSKEAVEQRIAEQLIEAVFDVDY